MKPLSLAMVMTLSLFVTLLVTTQHASADTCSAKLTSYNAPQFYLLSDEVFAGTVQHIDNTTDHQWKVYFTVDKIWRGTVGPKPLIVMTNDLHGCGYSIVQGEKYLVYTNGYPPFLNTVWSKPYADAQGDIVIIDNPKFQSDEKDQEDLNKKLVIARDAISNLMGSKMETIPFNSVGVDVINSTLDIGIDSAKAVLSEEEYQKKIKDIIGDIPIKITFGQIVADAPVLDTLSAKSSVPISLSPLQQFKSGIKAEDVKCKEDFMLVTKASDGSPACVTPLTYNKLALQGWAKLQGVTTTTFVEVNGTKYDIPYIVRGWTNKLLYITANTTQNSLSVFVESTAQKGEVTLTIPRALLDSKSAYSNQDTKFIVLVDKQEVKYAETTSITARTLTIPFDFGAKEIKIIATKTI